MGLFSEWKPKQGQYILLESVSQGFLKLNKDLQGEAYNSSQRGYVLHSLNLNV